QAGERVPGSGRRAHRGPNDHELNPQRQERGSGSVSMHQRKHGVSSGVVRRTTRRKVSRSEELSATWTAALTQTAPGIPGAARLVCRMSNVADSSGGTNTALHKFGTRTRR